MELVEIDATNEDTYYRCLHDEIPADPRVMAMRREWRAIYEPKGHRAKLLKNDDDTIVGLTDYIPIEHSPYEGENLMAILCMWIHGYSPGWKPAGERLRTLHAGGDRARCEAVGV